jgi:hypothetical protein
MDIVFAINLSNRKSFSVISIFVLILLNNLNIRINMKIGHVIIRVRWHKDRNIRHLWSEAWPEIAEDSTSVLTGS